MNYHDLTLLIPAYNEEKTAFKIISSWEKVLNDLKINYQIIIFNDGSTDNTLEEIKKISKNNTRIKIINLPHYGYNKTINTIYTYQLNTNWIFQADFDDEIMPEEFKKLWELKENQNAVLGIRKNRKNIIRTSVSMFASLWIKLLFGKGIKDVNIPFRLLKYDTFQQFLKEIPENTLYPNLFISAYINKNKIKMKQIPINYKTRSFGESHLKKKSKLLKHCLISMYQLLIFKFSK